MKLEVTNNNYCATVVMIPALVPLENSDNLMGATLFGYSVIVSKDTDISKPYILFTTESQLSTEYLKQNNLYSSQLLNKDTTKKGYMEANGRVKAIRLRGNKSNGLLMPLDSLSYLGVDLNSFKPGDTFNSIDGVEICKKYEIVKNIQGAPKIKGNSKKYERIDGKHFPEHIETEQFFKNEYKFSPFDRVIITQKLHGTSARMGNVEVKVKPTLLDKLLRRQRTEYDFICGSRRVIKDTKSDTNFQHYYQVVAGDLDIYNRVLEKYKGVIPKDTIIYGEIVGFIDSTPIQKGYTYDCVAGQWKFYVYRIATINRDGQLVDYSWDALKQFCNYSGLSYVPELYSGELSGVDINSFMDINYKESMNNNAVALSDPESVDEGVCIRKEGVIPYITKAKSPLFYEYETKQLDQGIVDLESNQTEVGAE